MTPVQLEQEVLSKIDSDERRAFVERAVREESFAAPVVASYELDGLDMGSASALTPNGF